MLKFYTDSVTIDQMRGGVNTGGRMTRKRTIHDLRQIARARQSEWWARIFDELFFMYLGGARGVNDDYIFSTTYTGFANNALVAPDAKHILYGNDATSKASLDSADVFELRLVDRAVTKAQTMGGGSSGIPKLQPIRIDGEEHCVICMHTFQDHALRTNTSTGQWFDIQKAAAAAEGRDNPIFKGNMGMYRNVVLHSYNAVTRFSDYGAGGNVAAARALFMGRQAAVAAFGSPGTNLRFDWNEESRDNGNMAVITTSTICGIKKTAFTIDGTSRDFGLLSLDTAVDATLDN